MKLEKFLEKSYGLSARKSYQRNDHDSLAPNAKPHTIDIGKMGLGNLKDFLSGEARFFIDRMHGPAMIKTATPERMHHLEQVRENDTHMADVVKELKKAGKPSSNG